MPVQRQLGGRGLQRQPWVRVPAGQRASEPQVSQAVQGKLMLGSSKASALVHDDYGPPNLAAADCMLMCS